MRSAPPALHQRFGDAELVDAVTQDSDVLLDGVFARFAQTGVRQLAFMVLAPLADSTRSR